MAGAAVTFSVLLIPRHAPLVLAVIFPHRALLGTTDSSALCIQL